MRASLRPVLVDRGYKIVSGGTDNHMFLVDLIDKDITGKDADAVLGRANITVNKNAVPERPALAVRDQRPAHGHARHHHPRISARPRLRLLTGWIADILDDIKDEKRVARVQVRGGGALPEISGLRD